jgi:hypothetical protein
MSNQCSVLCILNAHYTNKFAVRFISREYDARIDLMLQIFPRHVWLVPAVRGNHSLVRLRSIVDDREDGFEVVVCAYSYAVF